jgi:RNA recognition motif-containing protein
VNLAQEGIYQLTTTTVEGSFGLNGERQMPFKLYVDNLGYSVSSDDLKELFTRVGKVEIAAVVRDLFSGKSRGFGFVQMTEGGEAVSATKLLNGGHFQGQKIKVSDKKPRRPEFESTIDVQPTASLWYCLSRAGRAQV